MFQLRPLAGRLKRRILYRGIWINKNCECCACGKRFRRFVPWRGGMKNRRPLMIALAVVGTHADRFGCPWCGVHDRTRHLIFYLERSSIVSRFTDADVLHFAPERALEAFILRQRPKTYLKADLSSKQPDTHRIDLTDTGLEDRSFDVLIANHVLEHVAVLDDALREISRVLKPGGVAIQASMVRPSWLDFT